MAAMVLPKGSLISFAGNDITEHGRSEVNVDVMRFENSKRMHDGTLRKTVIADKLKWSFHYDMVPNDTTKTVDGKWGGTAIETFYETTPGVFVMTIKESGTPVNYNAVITSFSKTVVKRGAYEAWNVDIEIEEA